MSALCIRVRIGWAVVALSALAGASPGRANEPSLADLRVRVDRESRVLSVRARYPAAVLGDSPALELVWPDLARRPEGLRSIRASSEGVDLQVRDVGESGSARRIERGSTRGAVAVVYTVEPTFHLPYADSDDPRAAVARLGERLGIVRSTTLLPVTHPAAEAVRIRFQLPRDWRVVAPWERVDDGLLLDGSRLGVVEYIGLGDFEVDGIELDGTRIEVAAHRGQNLLTAADVRAILEATMEAMGRLPEDSDGRVVIAVPRPFLSSGSAGARSVVQPAAPRPVAHEILHWWIGSELTADDAGWFQEGVTTYYAATICRRAGLWSRLQQQGCLADLAAEARFLSRVPGRGLAQLELGRSRRESSLLYAKGAVVAAWIDRRLEARDDTLDRFVRTVVRGRRRPLDSRHLLEVFGELYGADLAEELGGHLFEGRPVPDLDLPDPTGRSGCAEFLPEELAAHP